VNPQYFQTLKLELVSGRFLEERDKANVPMVAVVNETFARAFFPNENHVGRQVTMDYTDWFPQMTIIGVVADFQLNALDRKSYPEMFWRLPGTYRWTTRLSPGRVTGEVICNRLPAPPRTVPS
jgi:hypothetical protein